RGAPDRSRIDEEKTRPLALRVVEVGEGDGLESFADAVVGGKPLEGGIGDYVTDGRPVRTGRIIDTRFDLDAAGDLSLRSVRRAGGQGEAAPERDDVSNHGRCLRMNSSSG